MKSNGISEMEIPKRKNSTINEIGELLSNRFKLTDYGEPKKYFD